MPFAARAPIALPSQLQDRLDAAARALLLPDDGPHVDFSQPAGEPALVAPDSVSWRVFKNPVALFIGGVAAVILELAEPRVRTGIWAHTTFRVDPLRRLQRTGLAAMVTIYGARSVAEDMIARVRRMHEQIAGTTAAGEAYHANDPVLLDWVAATAAFGFLRAYHVYVHPLPPAEHDRFLAEGRPAASLYGASGAPASRAELDRLWQAMQPRLEPSAVVGEFLGIMGAAPVLPLLLRPAQRLLVRAAVDLVPPPMRTLLGLERRGLRAFETELVRRAAAWADRVVLETSPAVQACRRLGLPADYLYRG